MPINPKKQGHTCAHARTHTPDSTARKTLHAAACQWHRSKDPLERPNDLFIFETKIPSQSHSHSSFFLFNSQIPNMGTPPRMPTPALTLATKVSSVTCSYLFLPSIPRNNYLHHKREVTLLTHHCYSLPAKASEKP